MMLNRAGFAGLVFAAGAAVFAQDAPRLEDMQITLKPAALTADYRAVVLKQSGTGAGFMDMLMNPFMMVMGAMGSMGQDKGEQPPFEQLGALEISWTKGDTQVLWGQTYLVTYKIDLNMTELMKMEGNKDFSAMDLRLQLIRADSIQTVVPRPDVSPEAYVRMLKPAPRPPTAPATKPPKA